MDARQTSPYVYLYQPQHGVLLLSNALQAFYNLPNQQRLCPPLRWFNCHGPESQQQLKQAFAALCFANDDNRLQLTLKLNSHTIDGQSRPVEHKLCMVLINEQRFICGRVAPIWNPRLSRRHRAIHWQSVYSSAPPSHGISRFC